MSHIIKRLQIEKLFGTTNIDWELNPSVNVLVGQNGLGKSTILRIIEATLSQNSVDELNLINKCVLTFEDGLECVFARKQDSKAVIFAQLIEKLKESEDFNLEMEANFDVSEDSRNLLHENKRLSLDDKKAKEVKENLKNLLLAMNNENFFPESISSVYFKGRTEVNENFNIEFISTINMSANSVNNLTTSSGQHTTLLDMEIDNEIQRLLAFNDDTLKQKLLATLNTLFAETNKNIEFSQNKLVVKLANGDNIPFSKLSSGERQVIFIFLKVVIASVDSALILMDEPEISLHLSWQEKLLNEIRKVNTTSQIIIVTHSPAMLMNGWMDSFVDIANIMSLKTDASSLVTSGQES